MGLSTRLQQTQKLREWRRKRSDVAILNLRKAYLQVHIHKSLWPFQPVMLKGRRYCLKQLQFGLNVAPMIIRSIMNSMISQDTAIQRATSSYINDVFVNTHLASLDQVKEHLAKLGLAYKTPEWLQEGAQVLGLHVKSESGRLQWTRGIDTPESLPVMMQQTIILVCGKLVDHFPVCGWLRVVTGDSIHKT